MTLNASAADDPEGNFLLYQFFDNGTALRDPANVVIAPSTSAVFTYQPAAGTHLYTRPVTDVGRLTVRVRPSPRRAPARRSRSTATCTAT